MDAATNIGETGAAPWDLGELCRLADEALRTAGVAGQVDGRVRSSPDARTVRYYTTLGLVDRPVVRGRSGFYGCRHLRQLVAIKRLQADGASLAEVQSRLLGASDSDLAGFAGPGGGASLQTEPGPGEGGGTVSRSRGRGKFWLVTPEPEPEQEPARVAQAQPTQQQPAAVGTTTGLPLGDGVTLLLPVERLDPADREALLRAAAPLLDEIRACGLAPPPGGKGPG